VTGRSALFLALALSACGGAQPTPRYEHLVREPPRELSPAGSSFDRHGMFWDLPAGPVSDMEVTFTLGDPSAPVRFVQAIKDRRCFVVKLARVDANACAVDAYL
jgi:hypothetical protein